MTDVLVLGGGIAGMSCAMELADDHEITVVERRPLVGGKARTWVDPDFGVFREHSFRVFHATYHNTFDTMRRVETAPGRSIHEHLVAYVSRADLDATGANTFGRWLRSYVGSGRVPWPERLRLSLDGARLLSVLVASDDRLRRGYGDASFEDVFLRRPDGSRGLLFQGLKDMSQVEYSSDRVNPDVKVMLAFLEKHFMHGLPGLAWHALDGPTSDTFIEPWRAHLENRGVRFRTGVEVVGMEFDPARGRIAGVVVEDANGRRDTLVADRYVAAVPSDVLPRIVSGSIARQAPEIDRIGRVRRVWNNGVIIYTSKPLRCIGGYYMWHPWRVAATTYAHRWRDVDLAAQGVGRTRGRIGDIISYVITDWFADGPRTGKPAVDCTPDEIYEELCWMCLEDPVPMPDFRVEDHVHPVSASGEEVRCLVDGSLRLDREGRIVANEDTLAHLPPGYSLDMPGATTGIPNLYVAGCHVYNAFGCGDSMEGANETGRRAANAILAAEGQRRRAPIFEGRTASPTVAAFRVARAVDAAAMRVLDRVVRRLPRLATR